MSTAAKAVVHDDPPITAVTAALDRVEHHLRQDDQLMADVSGAIVRRLLAHPCAPSCSFELAMRRQLVRWERLRKRVGPAPMDTGAVVDHYASMLLSQAYRARRGAA